MFEPDLTSSQVTFDSSANTNRRSAPSPSTNQRRSRAVPPVTVPSALKSEQATTSVLTAMPEVAIRDRRAQPVAV